MIVPTGEQVPPYGRGPILSRTHPHTPPLGQAGAAAKLKPEWERGADRPFAQNVDV